MTEKSDLRDIVRERYAASARQLAVARSGCCQPSSSCCGASSVQDGANPMEDNVATDETVVFGAGLYSEAEAEGARTAVESSLGCGVPTAVADLHEGETVLDLGSGAGGDVLISARRVGPTGRAIGIDMTTEMLELARKNAAEAGVTNVEFVQGYLEDLPLPDASVDVVISNCVINLAVDKEVVLAEAARVTRPWGRFAVSDVVADSDMDDTTRADLAAYTACIAGALTEDDFRDALARTGWTDIEVRPTHRVHEHAQSAIIRAVRAVSS